MSTISTIVIRRGPAGADGAQGADGATGSTGPVGPAPSGTGFVKVSGGSLTTPSATIPHTDITGLGTAASAALLDSDTMTGATASNVPSSESVKAYVDANAGGFIDVTESPYNAVGNGKRHDDGAMTNGSATLTSATASFAAGDVGKFIRVVGAGAAGADLVTTISARTNSTTVTLASAASTPVSAKSFYWGTDNTNAIQTAITAARTATTRKVYIPAGVFLCNVISYPNIDIAGAGAVLGQSPYNYINLAAYSKNTFLMPALAAVPVIRFPSVGGEGVTAASISDLTIVGGSGATPASWVGTGVEGGTPTAGSVAPGGVGFKMSRVEINGFNKCFSMASTWDCLVELCQFNYSNIGWFMGEEAYSAGPADGMTFISCGSNYVTDVFVFNGSKQSTIINGDYNNMTRFCELFESTLVVTALNIESCSSVIFDMVGANASHLQCFKILTIGGTPDLVRSASTSNTVDIRAGYAGAYRALTTSNLPISLPENTVIYGYSDSTFATLQRTQYWDSIARLNFERKNLWKLYEPFLKTAASPYGSNAWTATAISGSTTFGSEANSFKIYQASGSQATRLAPEYAAAAFWTNWRMSAIFKYGGGNTTTVFRAGLYSYDVSAAMIPANGIGMRVDTVTAGDATVKLEVIVGSAIQTVVNTGITLAVLDDTYWEIVLEKRGGSVHLTLINVSTGVLAASSVVYTGTMPTLGGAATPAFFLSGSAAQLVYLRQLLFEELN